MLRTDLRGRFASVLREAGSEDCFSTLRRNVPRARSQVVARIHLLNPHCSGSQLTAKFRTAITVVDSGARLALGGYIPAVRIPSPRAHDGRPMRRILIDSRDLDRLIERWKEVDNSEANPT